MAELGTAFGLVFQPYVLGVIMASAIFGLFVGAIPGLTATMATALQSPTDADDDRHAATTTLTLHERIGFELGWDYAHYRMQPPAPYALVRCWRLHA